MTKIGSFCWIIYDAYLMSLIRLFLTSSSEPNIFIRVIKFFYDVNKNVKKKTGKEQFITIRINFQSDLLFY